MQPGLALAGACQWVHHDRQQANDISTFLNIKAYFKQSDLRQW